MGNNLCKERIANADNSKSPIDRVIGRCAQMCPSSIGRKQDNYWQNHVLETSPTNQQPKPQIDGWKNATLTVPSDSPKPSTTDPPIAPPRKKRPSMLVKDASEIRNGFKEVFGVISPNATSKTDSLDGENSKDDQSSSGNDDSSNGCPEKERNKLKRKVSKVGNKKSDKFLGENLSESLSDEPADITEQYFNPKTNLLICGKVEKYESLPNMTQKKQNENLTKSVDNLSLNNKENISHRTQSQGSINEPEQIKTNSLDRKAEFLMAMLENKHKEENPYHNTLPVEEPLIVPKRKIGRHICDDSDKLHEMFHKHEKDEVDGGHNIISKEKRHSPPKLSELISPKKPNRDFSKYKKAEDEVTEDFTETSSISQDLSLDRPARTKRSKSRELLIETEKVTTVATIEETPQTSQNVLLSKNTEEIAISEIKSEPISKQKNNLKLNINNNSQQVPATSISNVSNKLRPDRRLQRRSQTSMSIVPPSPPPTPVTPTTPNVLMEKSIGGRPPRRTNPNKVLKKSVSSASFLTEQVMQDLVSRVYGFQMACPDEELYGIGAHDDGSTSFAPSSRLLVKKKSTSSIGSLPRQDSSSSIPESPGIEMRITERKDKPLIRNESPPLKVDVVKAVTATSVNETNTPTALDNIVTATDKAISRTPKISDLKSFADNAEANTVTNDIIPSIPETENLLKKLELSENQNDFVSVFEGMYQKDSSVLKEFQTYIENELNTSDSFKQIPTATISRSYSFEAPLITIREDRESIDSGRPDIIDSDTDAECEARLYVAANKPRDSIVELNTWFEDTNQPTEPNPFEGNLTPTADPVSYNKNTLFPFGRRERSYSASTEFFNLEDGPDDVESLKHATSQDNLKNLKNIPAKLPERSRSHESISSFNQVIESVKQEKPDNTPRIEIEVTKDVIVPDGEPKVEENSIFKKVEFKKVLTNDVKTKDLGHEDHTSESAKEEKTVESDQSGKQEKPNNTPRIEIEVTKDVIEPKVEENYTFKKVEFKKVLTNEVNAKDLGHEDHHKSESAKEEKPVENDQSVNTVNTSSSKADHKNIENDQVPEDDNAVGHSTLLKLITKENLI